MFTKNNAAYSKALMFGIFVAGMLSVSIANLFGGYYCSVAAITVILTTMYVLNSLDKGTFQDDKFNIITISVVSVFEILFFLVNDLFGKFVYTGALDFFGVLVIGSQLYSVTMIILNLIKTVLSYGKKDKIELVEEHKEVEISEEEQEEVQQEEVIVEESAVEDIKRIPESDIQKETPFMEESN